MQNRTGAEGTAPAGFPDCRDPDCEACRASREHGVTWVREKCLGAIKVETIDSTPAENRAAYQLAKQVEVFALLAGGGDYAITLSALVGAVISLSSRSPRPDAIIQVAIDSLSLARDVRRSRAGGKPS